MSTPNEPQNPYGSGEPQQPQDPSGAPQYPAATAAVPVRAPAAAVPGRRRRTAVPRRRRGAAVPGRRPVRLGPGGYGQPGPGYGAAYPKNSLAVWSLVLGIVSFVLGCGLFTGIPAVIVGNNAKKAVARGEANNGGMATAGDHPRLDRDRAVGARRHPVRRALLERRLPGRVQRGLQHRTTDVATVDDGPQALPTGPLPSDAPASDGAGRRASLTAPLVTGGVVVLATVLLAVRDPHVSGSYGGCPLFAADRACGARRAAVCARRTTWRTATWPVPGR